MRSHPRGANSTAGRRSHSIRHAGLLGAFALGAAIGACLGGQTAGAPLLPVQLRRLLDAKDEGGAESAFSVLYLWGGVAVEERWRVGPPQLQQATELIIAGTQSPHTWLRRHCYWLLAFKVPSNSRAATAMLKGLKDEDQQVREACLEHLGEHPPSDEVLAALRQILESRDRLDRAKSAAAMSLAQLGCRDSDVVGWLHEGLGSDVWYVRLHANKGMKAICGKDLTDFGYGGPYDGGPMEGVEVIGGVGRRVRDPMTETEFAFKRWEALLAFTKWLRDERPDTYFQLRCHLDRYLFIKSR